MPARPLLAALLLAVIATPAPAADIAGPSQHVAIAVGSDVSGDGGLKTASVLLSVCASATRHQLNPWSYLRDVLGHLAVRSIGSVLSDLLPDAKAQARSRLAI